MRIGRRRNGCWFTVLIGVVPIHRLGKLPGKVASRRLEVVIINVVVEDICRCKGDFLRKFASDSSNKLMSAKTYIIFGMSARKQQDFLSFIHGNRSAKRMVGSNEFWIRLITGFPLPGASTWSIAEDIVRATRATVVSEVLVATKDEDFVANRCGGRIDSGTHTFTLNVQVPPCEGVRVDDDYTGSRCICPRVIASKDKDEALFCNSNKSTSRKRKLRQRRLFGMYLSGRKRVCRCSECQGVLVPTCSSQDECTDEI